MEGVWESAEGVLPSQVAALLAHHGATVDATAGLPSGTGAVAGLVVGVLLCINLVLLLIKFAGKAVKGSRQAGDAVLLLGETGAGKTVLLHQLIAGKSAATVTSIKTAERRQPLYDVDTKGVPEAAPPVRLVDFPGHPRLRTGLDKYMPQAKALVFVVDCGAMEETLQKSAEYLYFLFTSEVIVDNAPPMMIVCNKVDTPSQRSAADVRKLLMVQLDKLRNSRGKLGVHGDDGSDILLGTPGESFDFDRDAPCETEFCSTTATTGDIAPLRDFLARVAV